MEKKLWGSDYDRGDRGDVLGGWRVVRWGCYRRRKEMRVMVEDRGRERRRLRVGVKGREDVDNEM